MALCNNANNYQAIQHTAVPNEENQFSGRKSTTKQHQQQQQQQQVELRSGRQESGCENRNVNNNKIKIYKYVYSYRYVASAVCTQCNGFVHCLGPQHNTKCLKIIHEKKNDKRKFIKIQIENCYKILSRSARRMYPFGNSLGNQTINKIPKWSAERRITFS